MSNDLQMPRYLLSVVLSKRLQGYKQKIVMLSWGIVVLVKYKCKCVFVMKYKLKNHMSSTWLETIAFLLNRLLSSLHSSSASRLLQLRTTTILVVRRPIDNTRMISDQ